MGQEATQKSITKNQYDAQTSGLAKRMQDYYKPRGTAQAQPRAKSYEESMALGEPTQKEIKSWVY